VVGDNAGWIWAFNPDGSTVAGFPMRPRSRLGAVTGFDVGKSFLLVEYDGDPEMEIVFPQNESITVVDGNGVQLTSANNGQDGKPVYATGGYLMNNPAVGDIDNDGRLEMVAHDSRLFVWDLDSQSTRSEWPQFKNRALSDSYFLSVGRLGDVPESVFVIQDDDTPVQVGGELIISNAGDRTLDWEIDSSALPHGVDVNITSGTLRGHHSETVQITITNGGSYAGGWHELGFIDITTLDDWGDPAGTASVPLRLHVTDIRQTFLPAMPNN
jgi:hypothetical protein